MRQQRGFTLIELMATLGVMAVVASFAVPTWQSFMARQQVDNDVRALTRSLAMARSEAVSQGDDVSVCPYAITATESNPSDCSEDDDWQHGWVVYRGNGSAVPADARIWVKDATVSSLILSSRSRVFFSQRGTARGSNNTWTFCGNGYVREVLLAPSGRVRVRDGTEADCT
ncbi:GspH/FimT family pseudopilin [Halomonas sp. M20]|uniref:GspH/FimT family pseudopilin n=1 Tax=Halomonas sp. M20 TaxID=2763264 RepID=UPI001D0AEB2B|nr:GspH/FimT family pseudopilin [Halomonas sp. M20]